MSKKFGFVYVLANQSMPGVYKIGCTGKSPRSRAEELSSATGVPGKFDVVCYIDVEDFQRVEYLIHKKLDHLRVNHLREFFRQDASLLALRAVCFYPDRDGTVFNTVDFAEATYRAGIEDLWSLEDPWREGDI